MLQRILVTGANKGVGLAIVEKILEIRPASFVYLGSRDRARGEAALAGVIERNPAALGRVKVIELDVTSVASVAAAASRVAAEGYLYGLVNNAGGFLESASDMFELNLFSQKRVTDAFAGTLDPAGSRIVFISSGAAPMTVAKCSPERRVSLTRRDSTWADVEAAAREYLVCTNATEASAAGFPDPTDPWSSYGLSKALLNKYVLGKLSAVVPYAFALDTFFFVFLQLFLLQRRALRVFLQGAS